MNLRIMFFVVPFALAISGVAIADTAVGNDHFISDPGQTQRGNYCGARSVGLEEMALINEELGFYDAGLDQIAAIDKVIPVAFHVIYEEKKVKGEITQQGVVEQARIEAQIGILNQAFAGSGFIFNLASLTYTKNNNLFGSCYKKNGRNVKRKLAISPANTLNVYVCGGQQYLSQASLPWDYPEDSFQHGIIQFFATIPGGDVAEPGYSEGDVLVHAAGHYLGLYHTFQNGCSLPGDSVDDTPYEESAAFSCVGNEDRDSCPHPGLDPITNYMDFTPDDCMNHFTAGQAIRMQYMVTTYKPSL